MAEYKEIHGTKIRNYTTNPDNPITGEVWYNDTDNVLKFQYPNVTSAGSWRSGGSLNTSRENLAGSGIYTAALGFGGYAPGAGAPVGDTESYNGTSWTELNNLTTARASLGGALNAPNTATLGFGGIAPPGATYTSYLNTEPVGAANCTKPLIAVRTVAVLLAFSNISACF